MITTVKPITATVEIREANYISEISESLMKKPSEKAKQRNLDALSILRRVRRG